jgi:hypothetical protein
MALSHYRSIGYSLRCRLRFSTRAARGDAHPVQLNRVLVAPCVSPCPPAAPAPWENPVRLIARSAQQDRRGAWAPQILNPAMVRALP